MSRVNGRASTPASPEIEDVLYIVPVCLFLNTDPETEAVEIWRCKGEGKDWGR